jgi:methyltransferase (TIGR00027 family)
MRAVHARRDRPLLVDDPFGDRLLSVEERATLFDQLLAMLGADERARVDEAADFGEALDLALWLNPAYPGVIVRCRYTEDLLAAALRDGLEQYVVVGAGLDTFALRRPDLEGRLRVYELDTADTLAMKRHRLHAASLTPPRNVHLIAIDLTTEAIDVALARDGFSADASTFIACLGVLPYLPDLVIRALLRGLADMTRPGTQLVFDYLDRDALSAAHVDATIRRIAEARSASNEPWRSAIQPDETRALLDQSGFEVAEDLGATELQARFGPQLAPGLEIPKHMRLAHARVAPH